MGHSFFGGHVSQLGSLSHSFSGARADWGARFSHGIQGGRVKFDNVVLEFDEASFPGFFVGEFFDCGLTGAQSCSGLNFAGVHNVSAVVANDVGQRIIGFCHGR
jgi:hypothetical protein